MVVDLTRALHSVDDVISIILLNTELVAEEDIIQLNMDAHNRILARDVHACSNNPPFHNSALDGYAFDFSCVENSDTSKVLLPMVAGYEYKAGNNLSDLVLPYGSAVRIFTGSRMPVGCNTVIAQERVAIEGDSISFSKDGLLQGMNCRITGEDFRIGDVIIAEGERISSRHMALLAMSGVKGGQLHVRKPLRIAVFSSGDEIREADYLMSVTEENIGRGSIPDANTPMLLSFIKNMGAIPVYGGIIRDTYESISDAFHNIEETVDCIITSGGASVGKYDCIVPFLRQEGEVLCSGVSMKPGSPFTFGRWKGIPVYCLPGNPVACFITCALFVRAGIKRMYGAEDYYCRRYKVVSGISCKKKTGRREFVRVRIDKHGVAHKVSMGGSGIITSLCTSEGVLDLHEDQENVSEGIILDFIPYNDM